MPAKGRPSAQRRAREAQPDFALARQQHPAVESAINNLGHRGVDRFHTHGNEDFARTLALSVRATNTHRSGLPVRERLKSRKRKAA